MNNNDFAYERPPSPANVNMTAEASGFSSVYQAGGDQVIYEQSPPFYLTQVPLSAPTVEPGRIVLQPSRMLRTKFEIVPFIGRDTEISQLKKWRDTDISRVAVCLIHGPGGQGKTRLAVQLARMWAEEGWTALQALSPNDFRDLDPFEILPEDETEGRLVLVDYADRWEPADLLALLRKMVRSTDLSVRIIMLSRPAGTWWQTLSYQIERSLDIAVDQMYLSPLAHSSEDRLRLFEQARDIFGARLGVQDPTYIRPPRGLDKNGNYNQVLTVHMAALAAVMAFIDADYPPRDPAELSAFLLARERDYWLEMHSRRYDPIHTPPDAMRQTVYAATLTGPLSYPDALSALRCVRVESPEELGQLIRDHERCYPANEEDNALEPLYPDRLGEDFIALTTPGHNNSIYPPDPWAYGALARLLKFCEEGGHKSHGSPSWALSMETLLNEIGSRWPHIASFTLGGRLATGRHHRREI